MKGFASRYLVVFLTALFVSCGSGADKPSDVPTLTFWHMWSEPHQARVIDSLVRVFEQKHNCTVDITLLSWANAKQKIDLAINAGVAPDVLHSSLDWVHEYRQAKVIQEVEIHEEYLLPSVHSMCTHNGAFFAVPWTVNTRTLVCRSGVQSQVQSLENIVESGIVFGLPSYEPHNVHKKLLPLFLSFQDITIDSTGNVIISEQHVLRVAKLIKQISKNGVVDNSRKIDNYLLQGKVEATITGVWLLEKNEKTSNPLDVVAIGDIPSVSKDYRYGLSILGGDCILLPKGGHKDQLSNKLATFLTSKSVVDNLAESFPEAGTSPFEIGSKNLSPFERQLLACATISDPVSWVNNQGAFEKALTKIYTGNNTLEDVAEEITERFPKLKIHQSSVFRLGKPNGAKEE